MTKRRSITTKMRVQIFQRHEGRCDICGGKIGVGESWEVSHRTPLEMGGADDETNWFPAHYHCHRDQTKAIDIPAIAKAKRLNAKHTGAFRKPSTFPKRRDPWGK
jgi:5-methylcytosine-specific restriction endonuclease McrA